MGSELTSIVEELRELSSAGQRLAADAILARAHERRLRVLVAGEAKRGKSTLLNRLLDRDLLPTGVLPVTAISTTVRHGDREGLRVRYLDGREELHPLDELARFVTERANPDNGLGIAGVEAVLVGGGLTGHQVELVDTPGTGSVFEHNTRAARDTYASLDAVIIVLTATPPMNAAERALLTELTRYAIRTFIVLNKADQLSTDELAETIRFTAALCADAGVPIEQLFAMSARDADAGFVRFRSHFETYLGDRAAQDSERALRGHTLRLAQQLRDETAIELRALEMTRTAAADRLVAFSEQLAGLAQQAADLADRCHTTERRLRRELDEQAHQFGADLSARCLTATRGTLADARNLAAAEIEQRGHDVVEHVVTEAVLGWREAHAHVLEQQLAGLVGVIENDRARHLETLRQITMDALGLAVTTTVEPLPLNPGRLFWLDFVPAPAVELPGTQLLRRHGPRAADRAAERVLAEIPEVTDRQVGRARADLQQRLTETVRQLVTMVKLHDGDTLTRLRQALDRVARTSGQDAPQVERAADRLRERSARIDAVMNRLERSRPRSE